MIYDNIKKACEKQKISICQLEKMAGLGNGTIGGWRESNNPRMQNLEAVAKALGVKVSKLLE